MVPCKQATDESPNVKLSTDTRHYRNYRQWLRRSQSNLSLDLWAERRQLDLCTYARIQLLRVPFMKMGLFSNRHPALSGGTFLVSMYLLVAAAMAADPEFSFVYGLFAAGIIFGTVAGVAVLVIGLFLGAEYLRQGRKDSIIPEYIKARKSKVCPLIEFEEE